MDSVIKVQQAEIKATIQKMKETREQVQRLAKTMFDDEPEQEMLSTLDRYIAGLENSLTEL